MRVYYGRRGHVRGYSTGLWGFFALLFFWFLLIVAVVLPIVLLLLAALLICKIGTGLMGRFGKVDAAARWRQGEFNVLRALDSFMRWTERTLGGRG